MPAEPSLKNDGVLSFFSMMFPFRASGGAARRFVLLCLLLRLPDSWMLALSAPPLHEPAVGGPSFAGDL